MRDCMRRIGISILLLGLPSLCSAQTIPSQPIDALVKDALEQWRVPGLALAIVHEDRPVYLKGHGAKRLGHAAAVTPDTVFPLASCTKPFTSLAVALMIEDGKMAWDDPVRKHVPFFRLADPLADAQVTIRDLLCHRTGVGSHDLLWYKAPWDLEERIRKIGKVELEDSFRSRFHYQTILYGTAGYAAGRAAGSGWQDLVQRRILGPLQMQSSCPVFPKAAADLAVPHRRNLRGEVVPIDRYPLEHPDPAGSLHASARDLARFLRFQLGDGTWQGRRLLAANLLAETHLAQMVLRREGFAAVMNPGTAQLSYGLGWILQDYRGQRLLQHGGAIDGFRAHLTLVPDAKLGIVLLSNLDRGFMNLSLSNTLVDHLLGLPYRDWNAYYRDIQAQTDAREKELHEQLRVKRKDAARPSLPLQAYTGTYEEAAYGRCEIRLEEGRLLWLWGNWRTPLEPHDGDVFLPTGESHVAGTAEFQVGPERTVTSLKIAGRIFRRATRHE